MSYDVFHERVDLTKAREIVDRQELKTYGDAKQMYDGDHWGDGMRTHHSNILRQSHKGGTGTGLGDDGKFWVGPHADENPDMSAAIRSEIKRLFVSRNAIREVVDRHISAIVPYWTITVKRAMEDGEEATEDEERRINEAKAAIRTWLDKRLTPMDDEDDEEDPITCALAILLMGGRSNIRLFVPRDTLQPTETGQLIVPQDNLEESLERIYINCPQASAGRIWVYKPSQQRIAIYLDYDDDEFNLDSDQLDLEIAELVYLDDQKRTVIRITGDSGDAEARLDLGGRLTMHEMRRPLLVTPQVISLQKSLNMTLTMMSRNVVLGGFLERVILNGMLPTREITDPETGQTYMVVEPFQVGAGSTNAISGFEYTVERRSDGTERKAVTEPSIVYREPVDVGTFRDSKNLLYQSILEECHQLHYLLSDQAASSGEARREAIADFIMDVAKTVKALNRLYAWMIETALAMASTFAGMPNYFDDLRVDASCIVDTGRISPDEMRVISELIDRRHISHEIGLSWLGIQDVKAELERLAGEEAEEQERTAQDTSAIDDLLNQAFTQQTNNDEDEDLDEDGQPLANGARSNGEVPRNQANGQPQT